MKFSVFVILILLSTAAISGPTEGEALFVPKNNLYIPVNTKMTGGLSPAQFNKVIDKVEAIYAPVIKQLRGNLVIERKWEDGTVNAGAIRTGNTWLVKMYGGLARHKTISEDGFSLVLCHEIGHHIGGAPKISSVFSMDNWASNEGEADYWGTLKCLRTVFLHNDNDSIIKKFTVPLPLETACKKAHPDKSDRAVCIRSGIAAMSVAGLFAALSEGKEASFTSPDPKIVSKTDDSHPAYQCRLDTFFQGALCEKPFTEDVSQTDEVKGTCHGSTGHTNGLRPLCWFRPSK